MNLRLVSHGFGVQKVFCSVFLAYDFYQLRGKIIVSLLRHGDSLLSALVQCMDSELKSCK